MRVLLDECVPRKLKSHLPSHECASVPEAGFAGKKNGELLKLAVEAGFEVFVTVDQGIEYEQNLMSQELAIIIIRAKSNDWPIWSCRFRSSLACSNQFGLAN